MRCSSHDHQVESGGKTHRSRSILASRVELLDQADARVTLGGDDPALNTLFTWAGMSRLVVVLVVLDQGLVWFRTPLNPKVSNRERYQEAPRRILSRVILELDVSCAV